MASSLLWGCSYIFIKELFLSEPHMTTSILVAMRLAIASAVMIPLLALRGKLQHVAKRDVLLFMALAFGEPFLYSVCETTGISRIDGSVASIITATIPLFLPFAMALVYKERLRWVTFIGLVVSFVGLGMMVFDRNMHLTIDPVGMLLLFGSVAVAIAYTLILVKLVHRYSPVTITVYQNFIGLFYFLPLVLVFDGGELAQLSYSPKMIGLVAFLGLLCSTLAYVFFNRGVRHIGATAATVYNNMIPISSLVLAMMLGQEGFQWARVAGMAVAVLGLFIAQLKN
ncbi:MAG: EamA family transporter [Bacteroidales bacterium]|nr:EamA family transporter [Bacteroidales bacterium]